VPLLARAHAGAPRRPLAAQQGGRMADQKGSRGYIVQS